MYKALITNYYNELTKMERYKATVLTDAMPINDYTKESDLRIKLKNVVSLEVESDKADPPKYTSYVYIDSEDNYYTSGSETLYNAIETIWDNFAENGKMPDDVTVRIFRRPSKNHKGLDFLTATVE